MPPWPQPGGCSSRSASCSRRASLPAERMANMQVTPRRLVLRSPLQTSWGELRERDVLHVRLDWGGGDFGEGEAAPLEPYDRVPPAAVAAALQVYDAVLRRADAR